MQEFEEVGLGLFDRCGSVCKVVFFLKVVYCLFFCAQFFWDDDCSVAYFPARFLSGFICSIADTLIRFPGEFSCRVTAALTRFFRELSCGVTVVRAHFFIRVDFAVPVIILVVFREIFVVGEFRVYIVVLCFLFFHI